MIQFDEHIFQMGWNHQLVVVGVSFKKPSPIGPTERTPEFLMGLAIYLGVRRQGPIQFLMEWMNFKKDQWDFQGPPIMGPSYGKLPIPLP